ncbi:hypothetical protein GCM10012275_63370 [Longimycelium tulufanense]|uniref:Uncharacterized protein n=1 Tax=Longimycelium tulufanense TaxID=907463 RepID=A0A8J3CKK9_9PSEU|nr:hypothetical protein [Longimycelium tulufanense]GGM84055.1 hypothetical protein GCM10012275_63370 [Longimycelium tulufanense]
MVRPGVVLGRYLAVVLQFASAHGRPRERAGLVELARAVLSGDGTALITFLHTARKCLAAHDAPPGLWDHHGEALAVVVDLVAEGAPLRPFDPGIRAALVATFHATRVAPHEFPVR